MCTYIHPAWLCKPHFLGKPGTTRASKLLLKPSPSPCVCTMISPSPHYLTAVHHPHHPRPLLSALPHEAHGHQQRLRHVALQQSPRKGQKTWGLSQKNIRHRPEPWEARRGKPRGELCLSWLPRGGLPGLQHFYLSWLLKALFQRRPDGAKCWSFLLSPSADGLHFAGFTGDIANQRVHKSGTSSPMLGL